jgi:hypothetical protein
VKNKVKMSRRYAKQGTYPESKEPEQSLLDSGFLSGNLDSSNNLSECDINTDNTGVAMQSATYRTAYREENYQSNTADSGFINSESSIFESSSDVKSEGDTSKQQEQTSSLIAEVFAPDEEGDTVLHAAIMEVRKLFTQ